MELSMRIKIKIRKIVNAFKYINYNKLTQFTIEEKIEILKTYNKYGCSDENFRLDTKSFQGFCSAAYLVVTSKGKLIRSSEKLTENTFIELIMYKPIFTLFGFFPRTHWFSTDEKGVNIRKEICNELLTKLEEEKRKK